MKKNTMISKIFKTLAAVLILLCISCVFHTDASAASASKYDLKVGKTYKSYDITGDKKADTIKITADSKDTYLYNNLQIKVNGKTVLSDTGYMTKNGVTITLIKLANGKPFLYVYNPITDGDAKLCGIYKYSGGKMKCVVNFNTFLGKNKCGNHKNARIAKIVGNTIKINFFVMSWEVGPLNLYYNFTYDNGTLKRTKNYTKQFVIGFSNRTELTPTENITVYKTASCKATAFNAASGKALKVICFYYNGSNFLMKVQDVSTGKTGYIKCMESSSSKYDAPRYVGLHYAG